MKNLMTSFLLLVALVSVRATSIPVTNGDFSSGDLYLSAATPNTSPWTNSISGIQSFTVATTTPQVSFTAASTGIVNTSTNGELQVTAVTTAPNETQSDIKITLSDITLTGASNKSTYVFKVDYKYPAGTTSLSANPNLSATFSAGGVNMSIASQTYTLGTVYKVVPSVTYTAGQYCTSTNILNLNSVAAPDKLSLTLQIAKALSNANGNQLFIDNITLTECAAAISGISGTTFATYQQGSGPSAEQSFSVSGSDLIANLRVTAGSNLEISTTSGTGFVSDSLVLTQTAGVVAPTIIYARLKAGLSPATYSDATTKISVISSSPVYTITNKDVQFTGTVDVATDLSKLSGAKLTASNGTIIIDGLSAGELVDIYDSVGKKVKSAIADGSNLKIAINAKGVYVVKIKSFSQKVVL